MAAVQVVDQTLFPGSHCLLVPLKGRFRMHKHAFSLLSRATEPALNIWASPDLPKPVTLCIPPPSGKATLPNHPMLVFREGGIESDLIASANLAIVLFRRGAPKTNREIATLLVEHARHDFDLILRTIGVLAVDPVDQTIAETLFFSLMGFYMHVNPDLMQPVLKQKLFSPETDEYLGHICAHCGVIGAMNQCPCRVGVYYCSRECQKGGWRQHRAICTAANKAARI